MTQAKTDAELDAKRDGHVVCPGCGNEIDPLTCWCGMPMEDHANPSCPRFAMGCRCYENSSIGGLDYPF